MKKIFLVAVVSSLFLAACSSSPTIEDVQQTKCSYPDSPDTEAPLWVCDVMPSDLPVGATGYAKKSIGGFGIMRKTAIADARANLAAQLEAKITDNYIKNKTILSNNEKSSTQLQENEHQKIKRETKSLVNRSLLNTRIVASQTSPKGDIYVLIGMNDQSYKLYLSKIQNKIESI